MLNYGSNAQETAFTVFAPLVAAVILISLLLFVEPIERVVAGWRQAWPPALLGVPLACIPSALPFSAVDPGHHWWRDGVAGALWGTAVALIGWRRWRQRPSGRPSDGEASGLNGKRTTHVGPND